MSILIFDREGKSDSINTNMFILLFITLFGSKFYLHLSLPTHEALALSIFSDLKTEKQTHKRTDIKQKFSEVT